MQQDEAAILGGCSGAASLCEWHDGHACMEAACDCVRQCASVRPCTSVRKCAGKIVRATRTVAAITETRAPDSLGSRVAAARKHSELAACAVFLLVYSHRARVRVRSALTRGLLPLGKSVRPDSRDQAASTLRPFCLINFASASAPTCARPTRKSGGRRKLAPPSRSAGQQVAGRPAGPTFRRSCAPLWVCARVCVCAVAARVISA